MYPQIRKLKLVLWGFTFGESFTSLRLFIQKPIAVAIVVFIFFTPFENKFSTEIKKIKTILPCKMVFVWSG